MKICYFSISVIFCVLTFLLGVSVIVAWYFGFIPLLQYQVQTEYMMFNTALCFVLVALALVALMLKYQITSFVLCLTVILLSLLTVYQDLAGVNFGLDQFFFQANLLIGHPAPGRMAPNTAASFVLAAIIILLMNKKTWTHFYAAIISLLASCLLFMSILFLSGYFISFQHAYRWGDYTSMALNTALGFFLLSISLSAFIAYLSTQLNIKLWRIIPLAVFVGMFTINGMLALSTYEMQMDAGVYSYLSLLIFILGSLFSVLFGLMLYYALYAYYLADREHRTSSLLHMTLESTADGIMACTVEGQLIHCNNIFLHMWRLNSKPIKTMHISKLLKTMAAQVEHGHLFLETVLEAIHHDTKYELQLTVNLKDQRVYEVSTRIQWDTNQVVGYVFTFHDITKSKHLEQELLHLNTHDSLTNLPNKALIMDSLQKNLVRAKREYKKTAFFLININRFTQINDVFGRNIGDELIKQIANRFQKELADIGSISRLGGDEFVLITNINEVKEAQNIAERIIFSLKQGFKIHESILNFTCSIGIAIAPDHGNTTEDVIRNADIAMMRSKKDGRNTYKFYSPPFSQLAKSQMALENELYVAVENGQIITYYQPVIDIYNMKFVGVEALMRWQHPSRGLILPGQFIETAEDLGLIVEIGRQVMKEACKEIYQWQQQGLKDIRLAVNVSAIQFKNKQLIDDVNQALSESGLKPECFEIELTEQTLIGRSKEVYDCLFYFRKQGICISLDDFGTGFSSLSYIKNFPLDKIKIDKSFIADLLESEDSQQLVKAMIRMAESLRLKSIAEGIENQEELNYLKYIHCNYGQGFYFANPMPAKDCFNFLIRNRSNNLKVFPFNASKQR